MNGLDGNVEGDTNEVFSIDYHAESKIFEHESNIFMKVFVKNIFSESYEITQEEKAKFGLLCQHTVGRDWFAKHIGTMRANKKVDELCFFRLVQYFAIVLLECHLDDDFKPALSLLNMCFTYYCVIGGETEEIESSKDFLYTYLKDQPIWKSIRFWTAAFLIAVDDERRKRSKGGSWSSLDDEQKKEVDVCEGHSAFSHLRSFSFMMKSFDIEKEKRQEFLEKMGTIENMTEDQMKELEESFEMVG